MILKRWTKTKRLGQQHETINRFLWYLVTEKIEEQDIVYGQTENKASETHTDNLFLADLSRRLEWAIVIAHRPSSVRRRRP